jgi:hypothetical protein
LVQTNGVGFLFQLAKKASMWRHRAALEGKLVRRRDRRVRMLKNPSTWFIHEALVGVK